MRSLAAAPALLLMLAACGGGGVEVSVSWSAPTDPLLDPFATGVGVELVRVTVDSEAPADSAVIDVEPSARSATFSGIPTEQTVVVRIEGIGGAGNVLAYGESDRIALKGDVSTSISVRRNLAYVTHKPTARGSIAGDLGDACSDDTDCTAPTCEAGEACPPASCLTGPLGSFCGGACSDCPNGFACGPNPENAGDIIPRCQRISTPEKWIYLVDVGTRAVAGKVEIPGNAPEGRMISARGGLEMLVTYSDNGFGFLGVLSTSDNSFRAIELPRAHQLALADPASPIAVLAGGGAISFVDLDAGTPVGPEMAVGGNVLDGAISAGGEFAIVILDSAALIIDMEARRAEPLEAIAETGGVAFHPDGRRAYLSSRSMGQGVIQYDVFSRQATPLLTPMGQRLRFAAGVVGLAYSRTMQSLFGTFVDPENGSSRVVFVNVPLGESFAVNLGVTGLPDPTGLISGAAGRRIVAVAGRSRDTAGVTLIDTFARGAPVGSSSLYPFDLDDVFIRQEQGLTVETRTRYRPRAIGVVYGR